MRNVPPSADAYGGKPHHNNLQIAKSCLNELQYEQWDWSHDKKPVSYRSKLVPRRVQWILESLGKVSHGIDFLGYTLIRTSCLASLHGSYYVWE